MVPRPLWMGSKPFLGNKVFEDNEGGLLSPGDYRSVGVASELGAGWILGLLRVSRSEVEDRRTRTSTSQGAPERRGQDHREDYVTRQQQEAPMG